MALSPTIHVAKFGGVAFDCVSTSDAVNQAVVQNEFPRKDGAHLQPMGAGPRRTRLACFFFERAPEGGDPTKNYLERYEEFYSKVNSDEILEFVHPVFGSYRAKAVGDITTDANSDEADSLTVGVMFVEDSTTPSPFDFSAPQPVDSGISTVKVEAAKLDAALAAEGLSSTIPSESVEKVSGWRTIEDISSRRVNLEMQSLTNKISKTSDEFELASNIQRQPIWRSFQRLAGEIRRAAKLFQQSQPQIFVFAARKDSPLRVLVADIYGTLDFDQRYEEIMRLNDIDDPMLIPEGTQLKATSPKTHRGKGLRSSV